MTTKDKTPPPCDREVFCTGESLWAVDSSDCGARGIERWIKDLAIASGQRIDWHYSGGVAHVLYLGNREAIKAALGRVPCPGRILREIEPGMSLHRNFEG